MATADELARAIAWRQYWRAREREFRSMSLAYLQSAIAEKLRPEGLGGSPTAVATALECAVNYRVAARDAKRLADEEQANVTALLTREAS